MALVRWIACVAIASSCMSFASPSRAGWDLEPPLIVHPGSVAGAGTGEMLVADMNGDGLQDIVVLDAVSVYDPAFHVEGAIHVLYQRANGFEFAKTKAAVGPFGKMRLADMTPDPGPEIVYKDRDGYRVLEVRQDGTFRDFAGRGSAYAYSVIDVNQDGYDDLFWVNPSGYGTGFAYSIDYSKLMLTGNRGWFWRSTNYIGQDFGDSSGYANGISEPAKDAIDIDADGYVDALEGRCNMGCWFRQEPYGKLTAISLQGDGAYEDPMGFTYGDLDGDGAADRVSAGLSPRVQLQTAPGRFETFGQFVGLTESSTPYIADVDLNGLMDVLIPNPLRNELNIMRQVTPGSFQRYRIRTQGNRPAVADLDDDGCPDLLLVSYAIEYYRGHGCTPRDIAVAARIDGDQVVVTAGQVRGVEPYPERAVRVVISPTQQDDSALGLEIDPPADCAPRAARAPLRMFDCVFLPDPGTTARFDFAVRLAQGRAARLHVNALLLDEGADSRRDNNRVRVEAEFSRAAGSADTVSGGVR